MQSERPKVNRAYVQVFNPDTRKSRSKTYYNTTVEDVFKVLDKQASSVNDDKPRKRETVSA